MSAKVGPAKEDPEGPKGPPQMAVSQELSVSLASDLSGLRSRSSILQRSSSSEVQEEGGPSQVPPVPQSKPPKGAPRLLEEEEERGHAWETRPQDVQPRLGQRRDARNTTNWSCSAIGLLCICVILSLLVALMKMKEGNVFEDAMENSFHPFLEGAPSFLERRRRDRPWCPSDSRPSPLLPVAMVEKRIQEEAELWHWKILTLTEMFSDLQIGKVLSCSSCKLQWMQQSKKCYLFRNREMNWHSSQHFCQNENAELMVVKNRDQMPFLRFHTSMHYFLDLKTYEYGKFWLGLAYDIEKRRWLWLDGTVYKPQRFGKLADHGCAYFQNGSFRSQPCWEEAKSICETTVQFGWSL